jgi:diguanylate cyclase (GGDEF)-like protein
MLVQGETVGLVHARALRPLEERIVEGHELLLTDFAERTALALANMRLRERQHARSIRDPRTRLVNRRDLEETFERELSRARRSGHALGVAMIDLDRFKQFNDRFGHQLGDSALQAFARYLETRVRTGDVVCRYGGEEFVVLFPDATLEQVRERCEALRVGASGLVLPADSTPWQATVSVGTAAYPHHGEDAATGLRAADAALYTAKRTGRDRVVVAELSV